MTKADCKTLDLDCSAQKSRNEPFSLHDTIIKKNLYILPKNYTRKHSFEEVRVSCGRPVDAGVSFIVAL